MIPTMIKLSLLLTSGTEHGNMLEQKNGSPDLTSTFVRTFGVKWLTKGMLPAELFPHRGENDEERDYVT